MTDRSDGREPVLVFDHGSVPVGDIDEAVVFYRDVLGLEPIDRPDFGFPGAWFRAGTTPVHLTTGGTLRGAGARLHAGEAHLAFRVAGDLDRLLADLDAHGAPRWELLDSPAAERQIFVLDPWGNVIELCTYPSP